MGLGRRPPGARRPLAGADGAPPRPRGQRRRRHHGRQLPPHLPRLPRPAPRRRALRHRPRRRRGRRAIAAWLDARPGGRRRPADLERAPPASRDWPLEVYGFRDHPTYRDNWPLLAALPDAWDRVARGEAVLVSEQLARRLGLRPGDTLDLPTAAGPWPPTVAAIYPDYGNTEGQLMVAADALAARWPDLDRRRMAVRADPAAVPASSPTSAPPSRCPRRGRRPARPQGPLAPHLREDLRRHRGAERPDPRRRRHRAPHLRCSPSPTPASPASPRSGPSASPAAASPSSSSPRPSASPP